MNILLRTLLMQRLLQAAYGMLFVALLPVLLVWTARHVSLPLPAWQHTWAGAGICLAGLLCMGSGMLNLVLRGKGLPMNAFPPEKLVLEGMYSLLPHPIYCGFVFACLGISLFLGSAAGLWLITPLCALGCAALVWGYERPYLRQAHNALPEPWLGLSRKQGAFRRTGLMLATLLPWLLQFHAIKFLGAPPDAATLLLPGEASWPVLVWTYPLYASAYLLIPLAFYLAPDKAAERLFLRGWMSMAVMTVLYLCIPLVSPVREFVPQGFAGMLLQMEMRSAYPFTAAFPSYHVVWSVLAAAAVAGRGRQWAAGAWALALGISATCVTTGMHAFVDVPAGLFVGLLLCGQERIWQSLLRGAQQLANSLRSWRFGPLRVFSHAPYSFLAGFLCLFLPCFLLRGQHMAVLCALLFAGTLSAALWGQLVEGEAPLQRPFGYFGSVAGVMLATGLLSALGYPSWPVMGAVACSAPWIQAVGRLRCLVQGCCHGREIEQDGLPGQGHGIVVRNPASRVCRLSRLGKREIYPTQIYSLLGNTAAGLLLLRLWQLDAQFSFIIGVYFIFAGLLRFVEEGYRGESQTPVCGGLPIYQWLAVAMLLLGCGMLTVSSPAVSTPAVQDAFSAAYLLWGCLGGVWAAFAMSVDWPDSDKRFARLSCE